MGIKIVDTDLQNMAGFHQLKRIDKHKDLFDRLIICYCINNDFILVNQDGKFSEYKLLWLNIV